MHETTHPTLLLTDSTLPLPLPALSLLSDEQRRGVHCAWCSTALTAETAVDAGERPAVDGGNLFPRCCAGCAGRAAYRLLFEHSRACDRCRTDASCPVSVVATRLMREDGL
ncbi:hypothetical protein ABZ690_11915 [Streptomyces sp. NPDC006967]|uniref:hypothetical protein n=1 Tax=Streptomyces sp. NPDC006967 TaxID=3156906 RepID=UPI0033D5A3D4